MYTATRHLIKIYIYIYMCVWLRRPHPGPQAKAPFCSDLEPRVLGSYAMCHL